MDARVVSTAADNSAVFTPHLKKVLKSFQMTSMRSLNGPDTCRPIYSLGYGGLDKDLSSSILSPFTVTNPSSHAKTNIISADGVYYKKRLKGSGGGGRSSSSGGSLVVTQCGPNTNTTTNSANNGPSSMGAMSKTTTGMMISSGGDNNNNNNDTTLTTSANKSSKNNSSSLGINISNAVVVASSSSAAVEMSSSSCDVGSVSVNGKSNGADFNEERDSFETDLFLGPPPFPIQQVPILTAADQGWSESKTQLEGEMISCFVVGGEKRLCLPQILNSVLREFSLPQINAVCDELLIYCSRCNQEQLGVLKMTGILPPSAPSCGLVTKTDCERLCNALLHRYPPRAVHNLPPDKRPFHFRIYHECFGKCQGVYTPDHFTSPHAKCIECNECHGLLSPQKFVGHVHKALENRTCHWGFDSLNWRSYILVAKGQENMNHLKDQLDEMKERFDNTKNNRKRKSPRTTVIKAEAVDFEDEEGRAASAGQQHVVVEEEEELLEVKEDATVIKKRKTEITDTYYPYVYDPVVACYYGFAPGPCHPHANPSALSRLSAFRPWSPLLTTKEGKFNLSMPPNTVAFVRDSAPPPPLPAYLSRGPPVLLNPERVVPISETERFERHYQPNVALAPPSAQVQAKQKSHQTSHVESSPSIGQRPTVSQSTRPKQQSSTPVTSKRLPESVVASSSSSGGRSSVPTTTTTAATQPIQHRGYSDIELSTDTDETFSDSTTYSASGSPTSCSSRNPVKEGQEKPSSAAEVDAIVTEMKCLRQLLEEEVPDKDVQDKVMSKVARICYIIEQKLEKSELSNRQLSQELDYTRMSKRERLREAAETKRQLRKEMERLYEGNLSLERQINEMRKDSLSLTSSLQRQIVLKREQTDEDDPAEEDGLTFVPDLNLDEIRDTQEGDEEDDDEDERENHRHLEQQIVLEEEVEDVKPNLGLLVASVSNGY